ncbi:MAG: WD40 repeat domain-containing protein [Planctomycetes bacterium]|nr:WD40 repeat domain-containing protein [Planctomycetota bacterium]
MPIELIVLGKTRDIPENHSDDGESEIKVEKVLYGSLPDGTIRLKYKMGHDTEKSHIFGLKPAVYEDSYQIKYTRDASELDNQKALSAARFDNHVLSSRWIFIGRELSAGDDFLHDVEIVKSLHGPELQKGQKITVEIGGYRNQKGKIPKVRDREMIYFVGCARLGKEFSDIRPEKKTEESIYMLSTRLPVALVDDVKAALGRRNNYPIVKVNLSYTYVDTIREILFTGTNAQAISMLGSSDEAAMILGRRTLEYRGKDARKDLAAALEKDMFPAKADCSIYRIENLILLLKLAGQAKPEGDLGRLTDKYLEVAAVDPAGKSVSSRILTWFLRAFNEKDVIDHYSKKLLAIRDKAEGEWKEDLQSAMDAVDVEYNIELLATLEKSRAIKPLTLNQTGKIIEAHFSEDGKILRTIDADTALCNWDGLTLKFIKSSRLPEGMSPASVRHCDGKYVICAPTEELRRSGSSQTSPLKAKIVDADDGEVLCDVVLPVRGDYASFSIHWMKDSKFLCNGDDEIVILNCVTGETIKTHKIQGRDGLDHHIRGISEDGRTAYSIQDHHKGRGLVVDTMDMETGKWSNICENKDDCGNYGGLVPGGKYLYTISSLVYILDRKTLEIKARKKLNGHWPKIFFSADGSRYAVSISNDAFIDDKYNFIEDREQTLILVVDTITGRMLFAARSPADRVRQVAISPDGRRVSAVTEDGCLNIWELKD